jgi:hypothetical protein
MHNQCRSGRPPAVVRRRQADLTLHLTMATDHATDKSRSHSDELAMNAEPPGANRVNGHLPPAPPSGSRAYSAAPAPGTESGATGGRRRSRTGVGDRPPDIGCGDGSHLLDETRCASCHLTTGIRPVGRCDGRVPVGSWLFRDYLPSCERDPVAGPLMGLPRLADGHTLGAHLWATKRWLKPHPRPERLDPRGRTIDTL